MASFEHEKAWARPDAALAGARSRFRAPSTRASRISMKPWNRSGRNDSPNATDSGAPTWRRSWSMSWTVGSAPLRRQRSTGRMSLIE